ncbi:MAG: hypothetical protein PQ612_07190 [Rickettsiales bacterium]|nr:hypothetical protein [Pseudomonadota bacterium]MDA0965749.1 hypothetical protein [Pseudomonadota bacterium]MDG4543789.1 hypothetical protein [Rickettsiales bacterium]MDG4545936.1 hypothetical protein [Rickettsiales bacterium]MDG4548182.1 hypothetical protein [Rickettsiales bacterium]
MLELKSFIKKSLVDIVEGVYDAGKEIDKSSKGCIAPSAYDSRVENEVDRQEVAFDIAVQVMDSTTKTSKTSGEVSADAKIFVVNAKGGVKGEKGKEDEKSTETISRIKFTVPVGFKTN